ncbi:MAG: HD domain-containing protein [Treponema sp.]|jgi:exopolyphosphatase/guanosine-5'-triphosphate,3'-diphosphate pyrophosphatase|nr:HD domain-containing protein [Treponema sp.]
MEYNADSPSIRLVAVLEIGSTGIRLLVAEITGKGEWRTVDSAVKPIVLGRDVFTSGQVSHSSLLECLVVLRNFQELLKGWGVSGDDVHLIATSALRAARNRDMFADRVYQETGYRLTIVEGIEENRLMYLAVRFALKQIKGSSGGTPTDGTSTDGTSANAPSGDKNETNNLFWRGNSIIIDIGGGSTEIMLLRQGRMVAAHSVRLGSILMDQQSLSARGSEWSRERYLTEGIKNTLTFLKAEMDLSQIKTFVVTGSDTRIAASLIGSEYNKNSSVIDREKFLSFVKKIQYYTVEECVQKLHISYGDAEGFVPGLLIYKGFLEQTKATQVVALGVSLREGLLIDLAMGFDPELQEEFFTQVIASAINLGRKYHFDEAHGRHVAALSMILFDALVREHGLNRHDRLLLETAALLHDIGMFIRGSSHQKHSQYIVANSEIFGIHREELEIIANVVRYHRGDQPSPGDIAFIALQREERILALKLVSILRVADALDRGHSQRIQNICIEHKGESIVIHANDNVDKNLERASLEEKANMFQDVFGYKVALI